MVQVAKRKIYTKTGDKGYTATLGGQRNISKAHLRIEACGTIDELNSFLGFSIVVLQQYEQLTTVAKRCLRIQHELFDLGVHLLNYPAAIDDTLHIISANEIQALELEIDAMEAMLPELRNFIIPGGGEVAARLHVNRTICRRLERVIVRLAELIKVDDAILAYVNRLSDWLFVTARYVSMLLEQPETIWCNVRK